MTEFSVRWHVHTSGENLWSNREASVHVTRISVRHDDDSWGEICAYFDTADWQVEDHGLIYTDKRWIEEFRALMRTLGFSRAAVENISYSEQGMQGEDYVSMDVGEDFLIELEPMYRWVINRENVNA